MKHQGTWGSGAYILQTGQMLEPQVQSSNEIRIRDGALMVQGALGCVKVNTYDPVTIQNGSQGMKRIDLICWQYSYDAEQDVESAEWVVIQGTPAETDPQQPAYTDGDIQQGDSPVQVPVFAVELDGINVTGVTTLLPTAPTLEELNDKMTQVSVPLNIPQKTAGETWYEQVAYTAPDGFENAQVISAFYNTQNISSSRGMQVSQVYADPRRVYFNIYCPEDFTEDINGEVIITLCKF